MLIWVHFLRSMTFVSHFDSGERICWIGSGHFAVALRSDWESSAVPLRSDSETLGPLAVVLQSDWETLDPLAVALLAVWEPLVVVLQVESEPFALVQQVESELFPLSFFSSDKGKEDNITREATKKVRTLTGNSSLALVS